MSRCPRCTVFHLSVCQVRSLFYPSSDTKRKHLPVGTLSEDFSSLRLLLHALCRPFSSSFLLSCSFVSQSPSLPQSRQIYIPHLCLSGPPPVPELSQDLSPATDGTRGSAGISRHYPLPNASQGCSVWSVDKLAKRNVWQMGMASAAMDNIATRWLNCAPIPFNRPGCFADVWLRIVLIQCRCGQ